MPSTSYDRAYYEEYKDQPYARAEPWLGHFGRFADRVVADIAPRTALDVGCALGMLVESLRDRGVEAFGVDISEYAVSNAREDIRAFLRQGSATDALDQRYDVIICIEVLEHLTPEDAERAVANIATHTDDVIFSSTPDDFRELTHLNVRGPDYWAGLFAQHGMFRDVDYDAIYAAPWAIRFRRTGDTIARVVQGYERLNDRLLRENRELREVFAENTETIRKAEADADAARAAAETSQAQMTAARDEESRTRREIEAMRDTTAWKAAERARKLLRRR